METRLALPLAQSSEGTPQVTPQYETVLREHGTKSAVWPLLELHIKKIGVGERKPAEIVEELAEAYPMIQHPTHAISYFDTHATKPESIPDKTMPTVIFAAGLYEEARVRRIDAHLLSQSLGIRVLGLDYASVRYKDFFTHLPDFLGENQVKGPIIFIGNSLGGITAQHMAAAVGEQAAGVVAISAALPDSPQFKRLKWRIGDIMYAHQRRLPSKFVDIAHMLALKLEVFSNGRTARRISSTMTDMDEHLSRIYRAEMSQAPAPTLEGHVRFFSHLLEGTSHCGRRRGAEAFKPNKNIKARFIQVPGDKVVEPEPLERIRGVYPQGDIVELHEPYGHGTYAMRMTRMLEEIARFVVDFVPETA